MNLENYKNENLYLNKYKKTMLPITASQLGKVKKYFNILAIEDIFLNSRFNDLCETMFDGRVDFVDEVMGLIVKDYDKEKEAPTPYQFKDVCSQYFFIVAEKSGALENLQNALKVLEKVQKSYVDNSRKNNRS